MSSKPEMSEINQRLQSIIEKSPSDASAELLVRKQGRGFRGLLKISTSDRKFIGANSGRRFRDVIDQVFREVTSQIENWKNERSVTTTDGL